MRESRAKVWKNASCILRTRKAIKASSLDIRPLTPVTGAEIHGVDLADRLPDATVREIHAVLMQYLVVFFRDQDIMPAQQTAFARRFGRLRVAQRAAFEVLEGAPEMAVLLNDESRPPNVNHYHTDGIFRREPEFASMLRAVEVPEAGGDTVFVNLQAAYDALPQETKDYLVGRRGSNDFMKLHGSPDKARSWDGDNRARMDEMRRQNPVVDHPLVRTHPVSGRPSLYLSESFTTHILDEVPAASAERLLALFRLYERPEFQCRFRWRPHSVALWDNRSTLHYALADYWPSRRLMHRLTIETDDIGR